jgi:hypothetical protein
MFTFENVIEIEIWIIPEILIVLIQIDVEFDWYDK